MREGTAEVNQLPASGIEDALTRVLRDEAQQLLAQAAEAEVAAYVERPADHRDEHGHRLVVHSGQKDERQNQTGIGPAAVHQFDPAAVAAPDAARRASRYGKNIHRHIDV